MKKTRIIVFVLALCAIVCVFASCNRVQRRIAGVEITVNAPDGSVLANGLVTVEDTEPTVIMAISQFLREQEMAFAEDSYGNTIVSIAEYDYSAPDSPYYWTFKLNGKDAPMGMAAELVYDQDKITVYCKKNAYANVEAE